MQQTSLLSAMADEKKSAREVIHVIVDNSNVYLGAQNKGGTQNRNVRLNIGRLVEVIEGQRQCKTREVVGTIGPAKVVQEWTACGYQVHSPPIKTSKEIFADGDARKLLMQCAIDYHGKGHTLVLVTGDGNKDDPDGNFPECVESALLAGWKVEVWAWKKSLNAQYYELKKKYAKLSIVKLDKVRDVITWTCPLKSPTPSVPSVQPVKPANDDTKTNA